LSRAMTGSFSSCYVRWLTFLHRCQLGFKAEGQ
jgi:hypothetical protein